MVSLLGVCVYVLIIEFKMMLQITIQTKNLFY